MTNSSLKLALIVLAGLMIGAAAALALFPQARERLLPAGATSAGRALVGGPFALTDQTGKRVTDKDFRGRYTLVSSGCHLRSCFLNREPSKDKSPISPFSPKMNATTSRFRFVVSSEAPAPIVAIATEASAPTSHSRSPLVNLASTVSVFSTKIME